MKHQYEKPDAAFVSLLSDEVLTTDTGEQISPQNSTSPLQGETGTGEGDW